MGESQPPTENFGAVPIFPLPNVVLFPRAILPLHIFEERYKAMTADALAGDRRIAMALLQAGWEKNYPQSPPIEPVVCIGTILSHERRPDGKFNLLLQGHTRARIIRESSQNPYRIAEVEPLEESEVDESNLIDQRRRMISIFDEGMLLATDLGRKFRQLLGTPLPTDAVADLIAFKMLEDVALKQSLLADCDIRRRVKRIVDAFEATRPALHAAHFPSHRPSLN